MEQDLVSIKPKILRKIIYDLKKIYSVKTDAELLEIIARPSYTLPITFTKTIEPGVMYERRDEGMYVELPFSGYINDIDITIPPGSGNLVGVRLGIMSGSRLYQLFPYGAEWFNVEVVEKRIPLMYPFRRGDLLWVEMYNADAAYEHTVTVKVYVTTRVEIQGLDFLGELK